MKLILATLFALFSLNTEVSAAECECRSVPGSTETLLRAVSDSGKEIALRFAANPVSKATNLAFICVTPATTVSEVKLWMPDMNHGSSPTRLVASNSCTRIERVNFIMHGLWDLQIKLDQNDAATLSLNVVR